VRVELVPHRQARLLQHVVGVGAVREQREDVRVEPSLVLEEQAEERLVLVRDRVNSFVRRRRGRSRPEVGVHCHVLNPPEGKKTNPRAGSSELAT